LARNDRFVLNDANLGTITAICSRLDGLPLAIELVASRANLFSPDELLRNLDSPIDLLSGGPRDLPERHRSLGAALEWSYALLNPGARRMFRELSVFAEGFDLDAARAVATSSETVLAGLSVLVDASLLIRLEDDEGHSRFRMLHVVQWFAMQKLADSGERSATRARHLEHFRKRVVDQQDDPDHDRANYRVALEWARETGDAERGLALSNALCQLWFDRSRAAGGVRWLTTFLSLDEPISEPVKVNALYGVARLS
jgi:predicted ATPase